MSGWFENLLNSTTPAQRRNHERRMFVVRAEMRIARLTRWYRWPILKVVWVFWTCLMDEGIVATCKPRWGALTFSFLNDGMKPTLWHTWRQITHDHTANYTGIYPSGAPSSLAQAQLWDKQWAEERERKVNTPS